MNVLYCDKDCLICAVCRDACRKAMSTNSLQES